MDATAIMLFIAIILVIGAVIYMYVNLYNAYTSLHEHMLKLSDAVAALSQLQAKTAEALEISNNELIKLMERVAKLEKEKKQ